ncbi:MFS transporter [Antrihabitans cavernicola]|nr:MFS transporter [Spelaeibacter cavernicola]
MTLQAEARTHAHQRGSAGYRRITLALFAAGLTTFVSMYSAQAVLPTFSEYFGVSPATSALAVSVTTGFLALAIVPASVLSERYGRRRVMAISAAASSAIGLLLPLSPSIEVLLACRAAQGIALAGVPAVAMAYLAEEIHSDSLGAAAGRYIAGTTIGGLVGRLIPAAVLDLTSWRWAMECAAIAATAFALIFVRELPESRYFTSRRVGIRSTVANLAAHLRNPALLSLFTLGFVLMGGFVTVYNYLGYRLMAAPFHLSQAVIGSVFLLYLAGTVSSAAAGRSADRFGRSQVLTVSVVVASVGLLATLANSIAWILIGVALFTAGFFGAHSVASGWVSRIATVHRAEASSLYLFGYYFGSAIAGAVGGIAFHAAGWNGLTIFVGVLLVAALLLAFGLRRLVRTRRPESGAPSLT